MMYARFLLSPSGWINSAISSSDATRVASALGHRVKNSHSRGNAALPASKTQEKNDVMPDMMYDARV